MTNFGKLGDCQEGKESFVNYAERMEQFFVANEVKDEKKSGGAFISDWTRNLWNS